MLPVTTKRGEGLNITPSYFLSVLKADIEYCAILELIDQLQIRQYKSEYFIELQSSETKAFRRMMSVLSVWSF